MKIIFTLFCTLFTTKKICFTTYGKTYGTTPYVLPYVYHIVLPKMLLIEFKKVEKGGT